jgi:hypothetical protein
MMLRANKRIQIVIDFRHCANGWLVRDREQRGTVAGAHTTGGIVSNEQC